MGLSPSCLNGLAERLRLLELRALVQEAHLKIGEHKLSIANDNDFDSPAWAQFRAWAQYLERLRDEEWALRLRLGTCDTAAAAAAAFAESMTVECPLGEAWLTSLFL